VLGTTLGHVIASGCPVVVVTTARLVPLASPLVAGATWWWCPRPKPRRGVGHSIAAGVSERPGARLAGPAGRHADDPRAASLAVADALAEHRWPSRSTAAGAATRWDFRAELYSELIALDGDEGARRIVARYPAHGGDRRRPWRAGRHRHPGRPGRVQCRGQVTRWLPARPA
jgi:molybdenum cofactor cytidylyltransferase